MSDVLVKGGKLPEYWFDCGYRKACQHEHNCWLGYPEKPKDCPIVEIPPHGRLIDADVIRDIVKDEIRNHKEDEKLTLVLKGLLYTLQEMSFILEAKK